MQQTKENGTTATLPNAAASGVSTYKKTSGPIGNGASGFTSSALGLDIKEDLGGGTTAGYSGVMNVSSWGAGADSASQLLGTQRHSFVYLGDKNLGEIRLGYQYTLDDQIQGGIGRATPTGNIAGRMQNTSLTVNPAVAAAAVPREGYEVLSTGAITRSNAIQYASPMYSGFQGLVQFAQQVADTTSTANANDGKATGKLQGYALKYSQGAMNLGGSYMKFTSDAATANTANSNFKSEQKLLDLAANYDLGSAKLFGNYFKRQASISAGSIYNGVTTNATSAYGVLTDGGSLDRKGYDLGLSAPFGKTTVYASVGRATYDFTPYGTGSEEVDLKGYTLAAAYNFSKRTAANVYYGQAKTTSGLSVDLKKTQVGFGLNHNF